MSSEVIVVLVLIALAIGFVIWIRMHDRDQGGQTRNAGEEGEHPRDTK